MSINTGFFVFSVITGVVTTALTAVATVDQVVNGDKRAKITGEACGESIVKNCTAYEKDEQTGKIYKVLPLGVRVEVEMPKQ